MFAGNVSARWERITLAKMGLLTETKPFLHSLLLCLFRLGTA